MKKKKNCALITSMLSSRRQGLSLFLTFISILSIQCNSAAPETPGIIQGTCEGSSNLKLLSAKARSASLYTPIDFPEQKTTIYMGGLLKASLEKETTAVFSGGSNNYSHRTQAGLFELEAPGSMIGTVPSYIDIRFWGEMNNPAPEKIVSLEAVLFDPKTAGFYASKFPLSNDFLDNLHTFSNVINQMDFTLSVENPGTEAEQGQRRQSFSANLLGGNLFDNYTEFMYKQATEENKEQEWCVRRDPTGPYCSPFFITRVHNFRIATNNLSPKAKQDLAALFQLFNPANSLPIRKIAQGESLTDTGQNIQKSWATLIKTLQLFEDLQRPRWFFGTIDYATTLGVEAPNTVGGYYYYFQKNKAILAPAFLKTWSFYLPGEPGNQVKTIALLSKLYNLAKSNNANNLSLEIKKYIEEYLLSTLDLNARFNINSISADDPKAHLVQFFNNDLPGIISANPQIALKDFIKEASIKLRDKANTAYQEIRTTIANGTFGTAPTATDTSLKKSLVSLFLGWHNISDLGSSSSDGLSNEFFSMPDTGMGIFSNSSCPQCQQNIVQLVNPKSVFTDGAIPQITFSATSSELLLKHKYGCEMTTTLIMLGGMPLQIVPSISDYCNETDGPVANELPAARDPVDETEEMLPVTTGGSGAGGDLPCQN